jgi:nitrile hydratase
MASARFALGDRVRVRVDAPRGHHRTPGYIQGKTGRIEAVHGEFRNPESLAYGGDGLPKQPLYLVSFGQDHVWGDYRAPTQDRLVMDIYEHWLEPA